MQDFVITRYAKYTFLGDLNEYCFTAQPDRI